MKRGVVDSHQHFLDPGRFDYFWMTPEVQVLKRSYLPEHLRPLLSEAGVDRTVIVQAIPSVGEAHWLLELASANEFVGGVVAWADLTSPDLPKYLDKLQTYAKFKGVRHQIEVEPEAWMVREDVLTGLGELERRGIPYDLLIRPCHLKYVHQIRDRYPQLKLVVDHIAKPGIAEGKFDTWALDLERVAELPLMWCKLSGMVTEANWHAWTPNDLRPYVKHVINEFGHDRVMLGSDWPVCTLAATYQEVIEALRQVLGPMTDPEVRKLWGETASEFYQLD